MQTLLVSYKQKLRTLSVWLLKYPTWSQVAMNSWVGTKLLWSTNAACISSLALASNWGSLASLCQMVPVPLASTSAQKGAIRVRFPDRGNGSGVNWDTGAVKEMIPFSFTWGKFMKLRQSIAKVKCTFLSLIVGYKLLHCTLKPESMLIWKHQWSLA